jgi:hypothetical protein
MSLLNLFYIFYLLQMLNTYISGGSPYFWVVSDCLINVNCFLVHVLFSLSSELLVCRLEHIPTTVVLCFIDNTGLLQVASVSLTIKGNIFAGTIESKKCA